MKFKKMNDEEIDNIIANVNGTMAVEGMDLTTEDKDLLRRYLSGEVSQEELHKEIKESVQRELKKIRK